MSQRFTNLSPKAQEKFPNVILNTLRYNPLAYMCLAAGLAGRAALADGIVGGRASERADGRAETTSFKLQLNISIIEVFILHRVGTESLTPWHARGSSLSLLLAVWPIDFVGQRSELSALASSYCDGMK